MLAALAALHDGSGNSKDKKYARGLQHALQDGLQTLVRDRSGGGVERTLLAPHMSDRMTSESVQ